MLVSFSVKNFRSFSEEQTFSMVASVGAKRKKEISFSTDNSFAPHLLRTACLFGPNGSGKSSLVYAVKFFRDFVVSSAKDTQEGEKINVTAFQFDSQYRGMPSEFEAIFIHQGDLYQYGFAVDQDRVWGEWLFCKPSEQDTKMRRLFQREFDSESSTYFWRISKKYVKGEKQLWKNATRNNALFLSTAVQLKSTTLKNIFDWIHGQLRIIPSSDRLSPELTTQQYLKKGLESKILELMHAVDIKIVSIKCDEQELRLGHVFSTNMITASSQNDVSKRILGSKLVEITCIHEDANGERVGLDFAEESGGTKVIFSLAGPWLEALDNGYTLIVDELHNSLHPHTLKFLVQLFHNPQINSNNAQLIFTSHETSVMAKGFMHQDQIWILEKGEVENSTLIPLSDFKVRDTSTFQRSYLDGRYGGVPRIRELAIG